MTKAASPYYYYADGRRRALELDPELVAVDAAAAADAKVQSALPGGMMLVARGDLDRASAGLSTRQPVFRAEGATIVVLPEVRVEVKPTQREQVQQVVAASGIPASLDARGADGFVIRPRSGQGLDALKLANLIHEQVEPLLSQARFVRVVPKPRRP